MEPFLFVRYSSDWLIAISLVISSGIYDFGCECAITCVVFLVFFEKVSYFTIEIQMFNFS